MGRVEVIARACHSARYACTVLGLGEDGEPWDSAPEFQKESLRSAVEFWDKAIASRFYAADKTLEQWAREHLPAISHVNWMQHKEDDGWVYGEVKDAEAKTHPCLVAYDELPEAQRTKNKVVIEAYLALRTLS